MKNKLITLTSLSALMLTRPMCADFFSAMLREQAEQMNRIAATMQQLEQEVQKKFDNTANVTHITTQSISHALNVTEKGCEVVFDTLKADKLQSHFDAIKKEIKISSEHPDGNTKISMSLKQACQKGFLLIGKITQSLKSQQETKNDKDEITASHVVQAQSINGFTEFLEQDVNLEETQINYNQDKNQLRIFLPLMPETPKTKEIPVTVE